MTHINDKQQPHTVYSSWQFLKKSATHWLGERILKNRSAFSSKRLGHPHIIAWLAITALKQEEIKSI